MKRFEDKGVLVTGAASGIGRATAMRLATEGARVACIDVDEGGLAETVAELPTEGYAIKCDLTKEADVADAVATAVENLGQLHALCNIAGVLASKHTHDTELELWNRLISVNLTGTFLMCRAAIPHLLTTKGAIVNTSSTAALGGHPWMAAYAATKGGVLSMTRSMAVEYAQSGLRVNAVVPGSIATKMHGSFELPEGANGMLLQRIVPIVGMGEPEAVAATIAYLASSDARYVNGADVRVDGGMMS